MSKCIFCESESNSFDRIEHLIPEALGGEIILPSGLVCDNCNNYFGRHVEKKALNSPTLSFMRTLLGIPNKRGKQRYHEGFLFDIEGKSAPETSAFILPEMKIRRLIESGKGRITILATQGIDAIC
jgi:hypothetical protein